MLDPRLAKLEGLVLHALRLAADLRETPAEDTPLNRRMLAGLRLTVNGLARELTPDTPEIIADEADADGYNPGRVERLRRVCGQGGEQT